MDGISISFRSVDSLIPYARNSRTHSDEQVAQLAASIAEWGWTNPVLADERGIVAGHGRLLAARRLYDSGAAITLPSGEEIPAGTVPVIDCTGWSETKRRAYVIADNKLALNAGWDDDMLALEIEALAEEGYDLTNLGFDEEELAALAAAGGGDGAGGDGEGGSQPGSLSGRFLIPPFSVLNAREGWWQDRKRAWLALGIRSELGRGATGVNSPHEGHGMADGLVAVQAKQKAARARGGLTWGDSPQITKPGLNYYRDQQRQAAAPGGSARPAADYSRRQRGAGNGRPL